jgi:hypothetical protein
VPSALRDTLIDTDPPPDGGDDDGTDGRPHPAFAVTGRHSEPSPQEAEPATLATSSTSPEYVQSSLRRKLARVVTPVPPGPGLAMDATWSYSRCVARWPAEPSAHDRVSGAAAGVRFTT